MASISLVSPAAAQALHQVQAEFAGIEQSLFQQEPDAHFIQRAKGVQPAIEQFDTQCSGLERDLDYNEDGCKKAIHEAACQFTVSFNQLVQSIMKAPNTPSDNVAGALKPILEKAEKVQKSYQKLNEDHGGSIDNYMPGLTHRLPQELDSAFEKLGGR